MVGNGSINIQIPAQGVTPVKMAVTSTPSDGCDVFLTVNLVGDGERRHLQCCDVVTAMKNPKGITSIYRLRKNAQTRVTFIFLYYYLISIMLSRQLLERGRDHPNVFGLI